MCYNYIIILKSELESLQDKLNSGKTLSTNESHELMDSQEQLDDIIHLINKLRLIGTVYRHLFGKYDKKGECRI